MEELKVRVERLEQELKRERQQRRVYSTLLVGVGFFLYATRHATTQAAAPPALVCKSLSIVDEKGKEFVALGADKDGGYVVTNGPDGKNRALLLTTKTGGEIQVRANNGKTLAALTAGEEGGSLAVGNKLGEERALLSADESGGQFGIRGKDSASKVTLGVFGEGGAVQVRGKEGKARVTILVDDKGQGTVGVRDSDGLIVKTLP